MHPHRAAEGCRVLDSVAPLKPGEQHCLHCAGFGGVPTAPDFKHFTNPTRVNPARCDYCEGSGKRRG